jgi:hypothetical protein
MFLLIFLGLCLPLQAQFFSEDVGKPSVNCKLKPEMVQALIDRSNPFFYEHAYDDKNKSETARLSPGKLIIIEQGGCIRHHISIQFIISPEEIEVENNNFITQEVLGLMNKIFFNKIEYNSFKTSFEKAFIAQFTHYGIGQTFNFPVNDRNFIIQIESGEWGAKMHIEMIRFVYTDKIIMPGIKEYLDDGLYEPPKFN